MEERIENRNVEPEQQNEPPGENTAEPMPENQPDALVGRAAKHQKKGTDFDGWKGWVRDIGIAIIVGIVVLQFFRPVVVQEYSMEPTLENADYLVLAKQAYLFANPQYGDIIVFHSKLVDAVGTEKNLIKRIVGLPGDSIRVEDGSVYRNGEKLEEDFTKEGHTAGSMNEIVVPSGAVFVMGDNRNHSRDSRDDAVGFVAEEEILGKVLLRVLPVKNFGIL